MDSILGQISGVEPGFVKDYLTLTLVVGLAVLQGLSYWREKRAEIPPSVTVQGSVTTARGAEYVTLSACEKMHDTTAFKIREIEAEIRVLQAARAEDMAKVNAAVAVLRGELMEEFREVRKEINALILAIGRLEGPQNAKKA